MTFDQWLRDHPEGSRRQAWGAGFAEGSAKIPRDVVLGTKWLDPSEALVGSAEPKGIVRGEIKVFGRIRVTEDMVGKIIVGEISGPLRVLSE